MKAVATVTVIPQARAASPDPKHDTAGAQAKRKLQGRGGRRQGDCHVDGCCCGNDCVCGSHVQETRATALLPSSSRDSVVRESRNSASSIRAATQPQPSWWLCRSGGALTRPGWDCRPLWSRPRTLASLPVRCLTCASAHVSRWAAGGCADACRAPPDRDEPRSAVCRCSRSWLVACDGEGEGERDQGQGTRV